MERRHVSMERVNRYQPETEVNPVTSGNPRNLSRLPGGYHIALTYDNGFSGDVHIVEESGVRVTVPPNHDPRQHDLVVTVVIRVNMDVKINVDHLLDKPDNEYNKMLLAVFSGDAMTNGYNQKVYSMRFVVKEQDLKSRAGAAYLENLNVVVSTRSLDHTPLHPRSERFIRNEVFQNNDHVNSPDHFGYSIQIVDNVGLVGQRYVNIAGVVYYVPVIRDPSRRDGVYFTTNNGLNDAGAALGPVSETLTIGEAEEKLRLYSNIESARHHGDELANRESELKKEGLRLKEREAEIKKERLEAEARFADEKLKMEQDRNNTEYEYKRKYDELNERVKEKEHQRTLDSMDRKDTYERRSLDRKDSSEIVKFLPVLFTGALALFMALRKV